MAVATALLGVQAAAQSVPLGYEAPDGCPDRAAFARAVTERIRERREEPPPRRYGVRVVRHGDRVVARLRITEPNGGSQLREVAAESCEDAVRAIALVTALAIDASVSQQPEPEPPSADPAPAQNAPSVALDRENEADGRRNEVALDSRQTQHRRAVVAPRPRTALVFSVGARATVTSPKAPGALFGGELFGALAASNQRWLVELSAAGERSTVLEREPGAAQFSFLGARLTGCVGAWRPTSVLRVMPCATAEVGALIAKGFIAQQATAVDPWIALAPMVRFSVDLRPIEMQLMGGATFPLRSEDRFVFGEVGGDDEVPIHDVPAVGAVGAVGIGVKIH